jgi:putative oxidoreductase
MKSGLLQSVSLLLLRAGIALLVLIWGLDKIISPEHAVGVSDSFYFGLLSFPSLMPILGGIQVVIALLALVGLFRRFVDPVILLINLGSLLSVWRSILDPWGWVLEGTNALFFPSLTVAAGCLVIIAFREHETLVLDRRRAG